ncbi:MAG: hypothetical protein SFX74_07160 [Fimbriimonadaceae bacterium]|nr:hypothetical protein [Fimbriimonadaceae bacterium]
MNLLQRTDVPPTSIPRALPPSEDAIQDYLDRLVAPLIGTVPNEERWRLREETRFHLERLRDDYAAEGRTDREAGQLAIRAYGSASETADRFIETWFRKQPIGPLAARLGHANSIAFVAFGLAELLCTALMMSRIYLPSASVWKYAINPATFHEFIPREVPVPELTPLYLLTVIAALVSPWIAGAVIGLRVPLRAGRAAYQGLLPCIVYSFLAGLVTLPSKELAAFAVLQLAYWLPAGMLSAHFAMLWQRDRRRRAEEVRA